MSLSMFVRVAANQARTQMVTENNTLRSSSHSPVFFLFYPLEMLCPISPFMFGKIYTSHLYKNIYIKVRPPIVSRMYHDVVIEHFENPRNVGSMDKAAFNVGTVSLFLYLSPPI